MFQWYMNDLIYGKLKCHVEIYFKYWDYGNPPSNLHLDNDIAPDNIQLQDDVRDLANQLLDS